MKRILFGIFAISYWYQQGTYSAIFDAKLRQALKTEKFHSIESHTAKLGNMELWLANHPYASFTLYNTISSVSLRPSRYTIFLLHKKLIKDYEEIISASSNVATAG